MQILAQYGFTLFQTDSDHLSTDQLRPMSGTSSTQTAARQSVQRLGLDWCYFPRAFPPEWYRKSIPFTRLQCLEHLQPVDAFSPWDPTWSGFIDLNYTAMAQEFLPKNELNPLRRDRKILNWNDYRALCRIYGDYGEAGFMEGARTQVSRSERGLDAPLRQPADHIGWWCDDALARADFRSTMLQNMAVWRS